MSCALCFGVGNYEQLIDIGSGESHRLNLGFILRRHFRFCFQSEPIGGYVCRICWLKVSVFHEFYIYIQSIHIAGPTVFVNDKSEAVNDEIDLRVEDKMGENALNDNADFNMDDFNKSSHDNDDFDGHELDELLFGNIDKVAERPTRKKYMKKKPEGNRMRKDSNESSTFQCKICGIHYLSFYNLRRHIKEVHNIKEFKCKENRCVESFETQKLLDDHLAMTHTRTECPHCKKLILVSYIVHHIKERHEKDNRVICALCGKISATIQTHADHHQSIHEISEKLQCDICGQWYKNKHTIKFHLQTHVLGPQTCSTCGKMLANPKALVEHKRLHKPEFRERFKCNVCGKGFRYNKRLKEHSHIHTGSAGSYHCNQCDKQFRFSSAFSVHKKKMHPK